MVGAWALIICYTLSKGTGLKNYGQKFAAFQRKMFLMYPVGFLAMLYFRWIARWFGQAHYVRMQSWLPRKVCALFLKINGVKIEVSGLENLPEAGKRVLAINHNSRFDAYILIACYPFSFKSFWSNVSHVTIEGYNMINVFGTLFDMFFLHDKIDMRKTVAEFKRAAAFLNEGGTVSFFPEGAFSADGLVHGFGTSCTSLAIRTGADIVPIVLFNTDKTFEKRDDVRGASVVQVKFLPPISTQGLGSTDVFPLTTKLEAIMNQTLQPGCPDQHESDR